MQTYHLLFSCFHEAAIRKMRMKTAEFIMILNHLKKSHGGKGRNSDLLMKNSPFLH